MNDGTFASRADAVRSLRTARAGSFAITVGVAAVLWAAVAAFGPVALLLAAFCSIFLALSPIGSVASLVTVWAGVYVDSCPRCAAVGFERFRVVGDTCSECGRTRFAPSHTGQLPGWIFRHGDDPVQFCSWDCRNAFDGGDGA